MQTNKLWVVLASTVQGKEPQRGPVIEGKLYIENKNYCDIKYSKKNTVLKQ